MDLPTLLNQAAERAAGLVSGAGGEVLRRVQGTRLPGVGASSVTDDDRTAALRWRSVTVLCPPEQVTGAQGPPGPLAALGERIELRVTAAPADKGTELAARYREHPAPDDLAVLRRALRESKALLETGEVLRVDPQPHGRRRPTPQGALLEGMTDRAPGEGVL